jgi:hypothetical protein
MTPHLDTATVAERAYAAELARKARITADREANAARIRERIADGSAGTGGKPKSVHCGVCGSPWGRRDKPRNACMECESYDKLVPPGLRDKMSPEELHPDHFPEQTNDEEE